MSDHYRKYFFYQKNRGVLKTAIRKIYLRRIARMCLGKTIDLGCGTGTLLKLLPQGSIGFEVNSFAVDYCRMNGLKVYLLPEVWTISSLSPFLPGGYKTLVMNHVLEHLQNPSEVFALLVNELPRYGIKRFIFVTPGEKGFLSDKTHVEFIDQNWFEKNLKKCNAALKRRSTRYFPLNMKSAGKYLTHNELHFAFEIE